jgi:hypothetical protein
MLDSYDLERSLSKGHIIEMNPMVFYQMVQVVNDAAGSHFTRDLEEVIDKVTFLTDQLEDETTRLSRSFESILSEIRQSTRRRNPFEDMTAPDALDDLQRAAGNSFIRIVLEVIGNLRNGFQHLLELARGLRPEEIELLSEERYPRTFEQAQTFSIQYQMFGPIATRFSNHLLGADVCQREILNICSHITGCLDRYYKALNHRHSVEGIKIHFDPITTDVAISIYENVDAHGEIQDGKNPDEISAYTMRKAVLLAESLQTGLLGDFTADPSKFIKFLIDGLKGLWESSSMIQVLAHPFADRIKTITRINRKESKAQKSQFELALSFIEDLNPQSVIYKEKTGLLTLEERHELEFRNQTLEHVALLLQEHSSVEALIKYILGRKQELREYNLEENSFYVCKIGNGNPFTGDAPGELTVIPGIKPTVDLSEVIGSGFKEVLEFMSHILDGAKWFDVFLATSPSKKADKSNVLLVGPQGSGKTEILRGVASNRQSIGIFAQASDFLTCWKGEAEKNPKRLFEAGLRIQRESKKQVFFLIDEIDTILNGDRGHAAFGGTNLATEFQVLMDGITSYPHLALWGATNHPERISMPLIRRFSKVIIVGELSQDDRIKLLKQFLAYLPCSESMGNGVLTEAATRLDGAVGDIMRKVVDHVWRTKMSHFVNTQPEAAEIVLELLNQGGNKFHPSKFTQKQREEMHEIMRPFVQVEPQDLVDSVDLHLNNIAIRNEIQTAKIVYENARQFLADVNN